MVRGGSSGPETGGAQSIHAIKANRLGYKPTVVLALFLGTFVFLQCFLPLRTVIQIGADEGFELAKATLCLQGSKLYTDVWNDQPPLHTFLITQILKHISRSILGPRLVTTGFALVLLTSIFLISQRIGGLKVASLTTALLVGSPGFIELSASCMLEIPALAPAVAALGLLLICSQTKGSIADVLAGALFGIAFQMKLVTIILLPLAALINSLRCWKTKSPHPRREVETASQAREQGARQSRAGVPPVSGCARTATEPGRREPGPTFSATSGRRGGAAAILRSPSIRSLSATGLFFVAGLALSFVAIDYLIDGGSYLRHFQQSWSSHFAHAKSFEYGSPNDHPFEWSIFLKNWDTTVPAILGIIVSLGQVRNAAAAILPLSWLVLVLVIFATHKPWWSYYYLHIAIPLCWCAAIGWEAIGRWIRLRRSVPFAVFLGLFGICAAGWVGSRVYLQMVGIRNSPRTYASLVLGEIERLKPFVRFIYTDESIYSFHAGIPMPPKLAVLPLKRLWSGDMTNTRVAEEMWAIKPEAILLRNDMRAAPFQNLIDAEYRVVYQDATHRLYTKKSLAKQAGY